MAIRVRAQNVLPIPNGLEPQVYSCTFTQFVVVNSFDEVPEALRRQGYMMIDGDTSAWPFGTSVFATPIDQPDCKYIDGLAKSKSFDHWCAEHADWSKLPDWPAWSSLMAAEPLGVH